MATYREIQEQIAALQLQAQAARKSEISQVVEDIRTKMREYGLNLSDIALKTRKSGAPVAAKYCDPKTGATWTGRGKPPRWLAAQIQNGRRKEDFLMLEHKRADGSKETPAKAGVFTRRPVTVPEGPFRSGCTSSECC
jgi:DNA-binding protein H-NS